MNRRRDDLQPDRRGQRAGRPGKAAVPRYATAIAEPMARLIVMTLESMKPKGKGL